MKRGRKGAEAPGTDPEGDGTLVAEKDKRRCGILAKGIIVKLLGPRLNTERFS